MEKWGKHAGRKNAPTKKEKYKRGCLQKPWMAAGGCVWWSVFPRKGFGLHPQISGGEKATFEVGAVVSYLDFRVGGMGRSLRMIIRMCSTRSLRGWKEAMRSAASRLFLRALFTKVFQSTTSLEAVLAYFNCY